jgi:hypothetical protein
MFTIHQPETFGFQADQYLTQEPMTLLADVTSSRSFSRSFALAKS